MEVKRFVSQLLEENCYGLICGEEIAIIDPGTATKELLDFAFENSEKIKYILLTHRHFDHILGTYELLRACPNALVALHSMEKNCLSSNYVSLAYQIGLAAPEKIEADILLNDGDTLELGGEKITVLNTPGHTVGSVCYIVGDVIFSGDTLFCRSIGRTDFETGSISDMKNSLEKLSRLQGDFTIYPGHGSETTLSDEKNYNPYMK